MDRFTCLKPSDVVISVEEDDSSSDGSDDDDEADETDDEESSPNESETEEVLKKQNKDELDKIDESAEADAPVQESTAEVSAYLKSFMYESSCITIVTRSSNGVHGCLSGYNSVC